MSSKKVIKKALAKKYSNKKSNTQTKKVKTVTSFKKVVWSEFFTPLDDRLVVKVVEKTNKTAGGIYIPDSVVEAAPNKGTVVAVGQGHKSSKGHLRPMDVKVGDEILFSEFAGSQMILFDEAVLILREQDVLGIVE